MRFRRAEANWRRLEAEMHALAIGAASPRDDARAARSARWSLLTAAALSGSAGAYATLLREVAPLLCAISRRRIADCAEAEGAVQGALLTQLAARHTHEPARLLRPWLAANAEPQACRYVSRALRVAPRRASRPARAGG